MLTRQKHLGCNRKKPKLKIVLLGKFMLKGQRSKRNCVFAA